MFLWRILRSRLLPAFYAVFSRTRRDSIGRKPAASREYMRSGVKLVSKVATVVECKTPMIVDLS